MKYLFSALLLLNIAFFVWQYQKENHEPPSVLGGLPQDNAVATLTLLSEVKDIPVDDDSQSAEAGLNQVADRKQVEEVQNERGAMCYTIGPFADPQSADQASSVFSEAGMAVAKREVEDKEHGGYWLHLPMENDLAAARQVLRDLKNRKISDVSIMPLDGGRHVVSLGVFNKKITSDRRYAQISAMGYAPVVVERFKIETTVWVDVLGVEPSLLTPQIWRDLTDKFPAASHMEITCQ
ncbi:MAG TPA: hypothetical protein VIH66_03080 [Gammaproteobacteria bacterium]